MIISIRPLCLTGKPDGRRTREADVWRLQLLMQNRAATTSENEPGQRTTWAATPEHEKCNTRESNHKTEASPTGDESTPKDRVDKSISFREVAPGAGRRPPSCGSKPASVRLHSFLPATSICRGLPNQPGLY